MAGRGVIVASVFVVVLGYSLYTPLPEGIAEPWKLRIILANLKMLHAFVSLYVYASLSSCPFLYILWPSRPSCHYDIHPNSSTVSATSATTICTVL